MFFYKKKKKKCEANAVGFKNLMFKMMFCFLISYLVQKMLGHEAFLRVRPRPNQDDSEICFYHTTYGDKARKCKPGCLWTGNGQAAGN
jgi:hypothetical protein